MATRTLISKLSPLIVVIRSSPSILRLRPLVSVGDNLLRRSSAICAAVGPSRSLSTRPTTSSLNDSSPNWSNRPPKETILLDGCDFEHWLVVMEPPDPSLTRDEIIDSYMKTLAQVLESEDEARMSIYSVSTKHYFAFGAKVSEELSYKIKALPKVRWVLPDSYLDVKNKDYGGEPFIDGKAVPYDPRYHEEWVRNNARANERSRRNDRPRNFDRSRNFERRRETMQNRDASPMQNQNFQSSPPPPPPPPSQNVTPPPMPNRDFNSNAPPSPSPPNAGYQNQMPNPNFQGQQGGVPAYQGQGYQGGNPGYPGGAPAYQGGNPSYQGGAPAYQGGNPSYPGGAPAYQGGNPSYQGGAPAYQVGNPSYQGGNPGYHGGSPAYQGGNAGYQGGNPSYQGGGAPYPGGSNYQRNSGGSGYQGYQGGSPPSHQGGGAGYEKGDSTNQQGGSPTYPGRDLPGRDDQ